MTKNTVEAAPKRSPEDERTFAAYHEACSELGKKQAEVGRIDNRQREIGRERRSLGPGREFRGVRELRPGSNEARNKALDGEARELESRRSQIEAEIAAERGRLDGLRSTCSMIACRESRKTYREAVRAALRALVEAHRAAEETRAVVDRVRSAGLDVCGPLSPPLIPDFIGRPDVQGTPLSWALSEARRLGITEAGEHEFDFCDAVSAHPTSQRLGEAEHKSAAEAERLSVAERARQAIRPIVAIASRRPTVVQGAPRPAREDDDSDADGGDEPSKTPVLSI